MVNMSKKKCLNKECSNHDVEVDVTHNKRTCKYCKKTSLKAISSDSRAIHDSYGNLIEW